MEDYYSVRWRDGVVSMLDQRLLPGEVVYREFTLCSEVADAIKKMIIRGAPAIGVAAGYGMALTAFYSKASSLVDLKRELDQSAVELRQSRPTAVNLFAAIERITNLVERSNWADVARCKQMVVAEALKIGDEDLQMSRKIGLNGQQFIPQQAKVIHHCNTGSLATGGYGTAMGVIRTAHEMGKRIHVYVDETRPRLQGARLTSWELKQLEIPHTVIVDGASGLIMRTKEIAACLVGCDRIAANGDVANKIGTYNLALVAHAHAVPFIVVGPRTTIDLSIGSGEEIPIEERPPREVTHIGDIQLTPDGVEVANPAFDVTPARYITAIVTDAGVALPPYEKTLQELMAK
ncbi:MAG: S-methyl-5-thioribose-1-phosphate isomerase [Acidobacteriaceae bacterium]